MTRKCESNNAESHNIGYILMTGNRGLKGHIQLPFKMQAPHSFLSTRATKQHQRLIWGRIHRT